MIAKDHSKCLVSVFNWQCANLKKPTVTNAEEKITAGLFENIVLFVSFMSNSWISCKSECYAICNCNIANIGVVAPYLSERLNNNLWYKLEKLIFSVRIYIFLSALFCQSEEKFVKCSHEREKGKFSDSQIFHFYESLKSSRRILLAFGFLLLFFHRTSFTK